jgi:hypothetical protein
MSFFNDLKMYGRFGFGLRRFLRNPITVDDARSQIRQRLATREETFLRVMRRGVFEHPRSPYRPLFKLAQCELGDIHRLVTGRGLEPTLLALREAGVYVTFEECKGRVPIVRGGKEFPVTAHDFDNPWVQAHYYSESGGSTGVGTRVHHDLDYLAVRAAHDAVAYQAYGILNAPSGIWRGVLPDGSGINTMLALCRCGRPPARWFTPGPPHKFEVSRLKFRIANHLTVSLGRAFGVPVPKPEHTPVEKAAVVARWAAQIVGEHGRCSLAMVASRALRVSVAAQEQGIDLTGVTFIIAGEPVTHAKVQGILACGASYFPTYGFSEAGRIGRGCCNPVSPNDHHLLTDMCAVIAYPRKLQDGSSVPAFNITCLLPSSPKILLNAESDDYGILERRSCGCPLEQLGYTTHVREIRSFRKLTSEGVTMLGADLLRLIEEVLPSQFGGTPLDYQLIEEEDEHGYSHVTLAISPTVHIADESKVIPAMLAAMKRGDHAGAVASSTWTESGNLRIKRMPPILTARGKLLPLALSKRRE